MSARVRVFVCSSLIGKLGTLLERNKGPSMGVTLERLFWVIIYTKSITFTKQCRSHLISPFYVLYGIRSVPIVKVIDFN